LSPLFRVQHEGVSEAVVSPCGVIVTILCPRVLFWSSVPSAPLADGGFGVVGLGALPSIKALSSPSTSVERSRFSARGSKSFWLFFSVLSLYYVLLG